MKWYILKYSLVQGNEFEIISDIYEMAVRTGESTYKPGDT